MWQRSKLKLILGIILVVALVTTVGAQNQGRTVKAGKYEIQVRPDSFDEWEFVHVQATLGKQKVGHHYMVRSNSDRAVSEDAIRNLVEAAKKELQSPPL